MRGSRQQEKERPMGDGDEKTGGERETKQLYKKEVKRREEGSRSVKGETEIQGGGGMV